jgi:hypothetical protein
MSTLDRDGWQLWPRSGATAAWATAAAAAAADVLADPAQQARWLRHGGTWFAGVDALPNAADGSIGGVPLDGPWRASLGWHGAWHPAQLSVVYPGYPRRDPGEGEAAHRFRRDRDGAHLDGLLAEGPARRRHLREPHAFILGLPLSPMRAGTAPFVVWQGSHFVIGRALSAALAGVAPERWGDADLTEAYQAARREVFATCPRVVVTAAPGEAILCHRRAIHGTAPWTGAAAEARIVAWFRPLLPAPGAWLADPAAAARGRPAPATLRIPPQT